MKGIVFTTLNSFVVEKFGFEAWEMLLESAKPQSQGIYLSTETYQNEELMTLLGTLCQQKSLEIEDAIEEFGFYMFETLATHYPVFIKPGMNLKDFLLTIHNVIHVEVRKLYPDASLPVITYEDPAPMRLVMIYKSPRKLCRLAEGLIKGAAKHFKTKIDVKHIMCMHKGADHCRIEIIFLTELIPIQ